MCVKAKREERQRRRWSPRRRRANEEAKGFYVCRGTFVMELERQVTRLARAEVTRSRNVVHLSHKSLAGRARGDIDAAKSFARKTALSTVHIPAAWSRISSDCWILYRSKFSSFWHLSHSCKRARWRSDDMISQTPINIRNMTKEEHEASWLPKA